MALNISTRDVRVVKGPVTHCTVKQNVQRPKSLLVRQVVPIFLEVDLSSVLAVFAV